MPRVSTPSRRSGTTERRDARCLFERFVAEADGRIVASCFVSEPVKTREDKPRGIRFLEKRGFRRVLPEQMVRLDVTRFDAARFADKVEGVRAAGIEIVTLDTLKLRDPDWERKLWDFDWSIHQDVPAPEPHARQSFESFRASLRAPGFLSDRYLVALDGDRYVGLTHLLRAKADARTDTGVAEAASAQWGGERTEGDGMSKAQGFNGFPKETVRFYRELAKHNDRVWFEAHKDTYRDKVLAPAQEFVLALGEGLKRMAPGIVADPRTSGAGSIFRIYRDTRFSKDKRPYKTYLGILFWEGSGKKADKSGFYFHLEPTGLMLGAGTFMFTKPDLHAFRKAVVHRTHGPGLAKAIHGVTAKGYGIGGAHYKRVPRGFDPAHPNAEYLRHNGLYAYTEGRIPSELYRRDLLGFCLKAFKDMHPIHQWIVGNVK